ncbi:hypothetical protein ACW73L_19590 [Methylolobus aquaticus]
MLDAVDRLLAILPEETKTELAEQPREDMFFCLSLMSEYLQPICGVWAGNDALLEDCRAWADTAVLDSEWEPAALYESPHPDEASCTILETLWDALHEWPAPEAIESLGQYGAVDHRRDGRARLRAFS